MHSTRLNPLQRRTLQPGSRVFVLYDEESPLWHERAILAQIHTTSYIILTPDYDVYEEDLAETVGEIYRTGPQGGLPAPIMKEATHRFDSAQLRSELPDLLVQGAQDAEDAKRLQKGKGRGGPERARGDDD